VRYRVQLRLMVRPAGWGAGERMMDHWDDVGGVRAAWEGEHVEQFVDEYPADYPKPLTSPEADSEARTLIASTSPRLLRTILQFEVPPGGLARTLGGHLEVLAPDGRRLGRSTLWHLGERPPKNRPLRIGLIEADGKAIEQLETVRVRFTGLHEYWAGSLEIDVPVGHPE
jgi:hypothetical protein